MDAPTIHSSYLREAFDKRVFFKAVDDAIKFLEPRTSEFDAIAFRGNSGALMASVLAYKLDKSLIMVRKEDEHSHSDNYNGGVEGRDCTNYLIVDDFIASGQTIRVICNKIRLSKLKGTPIGIYVWRDGFASGRAHVAGIDEYKQIPVLNCTQV